MQGCTYYSSINIFSSIKNSKNSKLTFYSSLDYDFFQRRFKTIIIKVFFWALPQGSGFSGLRYRYGANEKLALNPYNP